MYSHNPNPQPPILHSRNLRQLSRHRFNPVIFCSLAAIKSHPTYLRRRFTTHLTAIILCKRLQQRRYALKLSKLGDNGTITSSLAEEVKVVKKACRLRSGEGVDVTGSDSEEWWNGDDEFDIPDGQPRSWNEGLEEEREKSISEVIGMGGDGVSGGDGGPNGGSDDNQDGGGNSGNGDEYGEKWNRNESNFSSTASEDEERDDDTAGDGEEVAVEEQDEKKANSRVASPTGSPNITKSTGFNFFHSDRLGSSFDVSAITHNAPNPSRTLNPASFSSTFQQRYSNSQNREQESVSSSISTDISDAQQSSLDQSTLQLLYNPISSPESQELDNNSDSKYSDIPDAQRSSPPLINLEARSATALRTQYSPASSRSSRRLVPPVQYWYLV